MDHVVCTDRRVRTRRSRHRERRPVRVVVRREDVVGVRLEGVLTERVRHGVAVGVEEDRELATLFRSFRLATMSTSKPIQYWMHHRGIDVAQLVAATGLDKKVVEAMIEGRWTPSPRQRERLAAALAVETADIQWGHADQVDHMYGHGPQFGRSP